MEAKQCSFRFMLGQMRLEIPFFQRKYVWTEENWTELLENLLDDRQTHFLGSIILKLERVNAGEVPVWSVIDGQQRLTTLSILLKACYDSYPEDDKEDIIDDIRAALWYKNKSGDKKRIIKLNLSYHDMEAYKKIISGISKNDLSNIILARDTENAKNESHKILQCYKFFRQRLNDTNIINKIIDILTIDSWETLVKIELKKDENEQAIFDTINSAGVRLTSADIIKNSIFQRLRILLGYDKTKEAIELYKNTWEKVFENDSETISYWSQISSIGRIKRDNQEGLLHCVALIEGFYNPAVDMLVNLPDKYKAYIQNMDLNELCEFIEKLCNYASKYREIFRIQDSSTMYTFNNDVQRIVHIFRTLDIATFNAYILYLIYMDKSNGDTISPNTRIALKSLESYVMRCIVSRTSTKSFNLECVDFIIGKKTPTENIKANAALSDLNMDLCLRNIPSNKIGNIILFWIELARRTDDKKFDIDSLKYEYTLEHVMPQKWQEYWSVDALPVLDEQGNEIKDNSEAEKVRQSVIYELGNMTLLKTNLNSSLRNYCFAKKITGEGRKKGIKAYSSLNIAEEVVDVYDQGKTWNESIIRERTGRLLEEFKNIWPA